MAAFLIDFDSIFDDWMKKILKVYKMPCYRRENRAMPL